MYDGRFKINYKIEIENEKYSMYIMDVLKLILNFIKK